MIKRYDVTMGCWVVGYWKNNTQFFIVYTEK